MNICAAFILLLITWSWRTDGAVIPEGESTQNKTLTIGVLAAYEYWSYRYLPAIVPALQMVEELQLLPGYTIEWTWKETYCHPPTGNNNLL